MNPQANQTPGLGLPQPSFEMGQAASSHAPTTFSPPQGVPQQFGPMAAPQPAMQAMPGAQQKMPPVAQQPQQPAVMPPALPVEEAVVSQSDEGDSALDEEWVGKAREIVQRTHSDPYLQSRELGKLKTQFIKARYNKDIKGVEDQS